MEFSFGWTEATIVGAILAILLGIDLWRMKSQSLPKWRYMSTIGAFGLLVIFLLLCAVLN